MHTIYFWELFLIGIGLSMDAFAVSTCKGLAMQKLTLGKACIVGAWFGVFQALMPVAGYILGAQFEQYVSKVSPWISFGLLALIGGNMIREAFFEEEEEQSGGLKAGEMFLLAVATSIDALAAGITFVAVPVEILDSGRLANVILAATITGVITCILSMIGVWTGSTFGDRFRAGAGIMGGIILLFLALHSLAEHLDSVNTLSGTETIFGLLTFTVVFALVMLRIFR